jgi:hypothetical protein
MPHPDSEAIRYPIGRFVKPDRFNPADRRSWLQAIAALPSWLDVLMQNLDAEQLETPYREGGWNMNQVIHHLADSHMNAFIRLKLALTENEPTVKPYEETRWAETPEIQSVPANVSITLLHALHRRWTDLLERMTDTDWERGYYHPELQQVVPLWEMTAKYAWHGRHHMEQLRAMREREGWSLY